MDGRDGTGLDWERRKLLARSILAVSRHFCSFILDFVQVSCFWWWWWWFQAAMPERERKGSKQELGASWKLTAAEAIEMNFRVLVCVFAFYCESRVELSWVLFVHLRSKCSLIRFQLSVACLFQKFCLSVMTSFQITPDLSSLARGYGEWVSEWASPSAFVRFGSDRTAPTALRCRLVKWES